MIMQKDEGRTTSSGIRSVSVMESVQGVCNRKIELQIARILVALNLHLYGTQGRVQINGLDIQLVRGRCLPKALSAIKL